MPVDQSAVFLGMDPAGSRLAGRLYGADEAPLGTMVLDVECDVAEGPEMFLSALGRLTTLLLSESGLPWTAISGVGVGLPAPLKAGVIQDKANMEHDAWTHWAAADRIRDYFEGVPVVVDNDANVTAYGEWIKVNPEHKSSLIVVVTIGTGIGGGIIDDGKLFRGQGGAGEFGRVGITLDPQRYWDEEHAGTAVEETVEYFASTVALERQLAEKFSDTQFDPEHLHPLWEIGRTNTAVPNWKRMAGEVVRLANAGDELCLHLMELREEAIGRLFAAIGLMFNPHIFVVGLRRIPRDAMDFEPKFIAGVQRQMEQRLKQALPGYDYLLIPAKLGDEAGVFGAAMLARDDGVR